jgi:hypothetical protein
LQQWLGFMEDFLAGLERLRMAAVPLECVPPMYRAEAEAELTNSSAPLRPREPSPPPPTATGTAARGRKLQQYADLLATAVDYEALRAATAAAAAARLSDVKSLFLNLRITEFATAIFELVVFEQVSEDINIQNMFQTFFRPLAFQKVARLQFDMIAGKEALFRLLASPPPPKAKAPAPAAGVQPATTAPVSGR